MADKETNTIETKVEQVDVNLDEIFNIAPTGESVTLPEGKEEKKSFFSRKKKADTSFLNPDASKEEVKEEEKVKEGEEETKEAATKIEKPKEKVNVDEILGINEEESTEEEATTKRGRKPIEGIGDVFSKLIKEEKIVPFDDEKSLEEYTAKDYEELIQANLEEKANEARRETPQKFFESLPEELQIAARYVADGGTDLKGLFGALSTVEETKELDVKSEPDQRKIITEYLSATGYGDAKEIQEEIEIWEDLGKLEKQANKFKPKLDKMQEKVVAARLKEQEMKKKQQQQASENYMNSVYNTLKDGKVGEININKKTQSLLYNGLVNPNYPSINGKNTNLLGHLLEKYQFVEPNYDLITEALWLLADPNGYKSTLMKKGETKAVEQTVRKLKTAEASKATSATGITKEETTTARRKLPRQKNIFKRF